MTRKEAAERAAEIAKANREYHPCDIGLHICGQIEDEDGERPLTLANHPLASDAEARRVFALLRAEFEAPEDDVMVDLQVGDCNCEANFGMSRQMLPRLAAAVARAGGGA
jgi:hypothetical protein